MTSCNTVGTVGWILLSVVLIEIAVLGWTLHGARKNLAAVRNLRQEWTARIDELQKTHIPDIQP